MDQSILNSFSQLPVPGPQTKALMSDIMNTPGELDSPKRNNNLQNDSTGSPGPSSKLPETTIPAAEKISKKSKILAGRNKLSQKFPQFPEKC